MLLVFMCIFMIFYIYVSKFIFVFFLRGIVYLFIFVNSYLDFVVFTAEKKVWFRGVWVLRLDSLDLNFSLLFYFGKVIEFLF